MVRRWVVKDERFRIGLAIPLQGPAGLFAPSCEAAAALAVAQINTAGGICGREATLETIEAGDSPSKVARRVQEALGSNRIDALTGWHISAVCKQIAPLVEGRIPYIYPVLYEGGGFGRGVICSGEVPELQIRPALAWLKRSMGLRRWALVGDDYIWPQSTARRVRLFCHELGLDLVDEVFVRYGSSDFSGAIDRVARAHADAVLMLLVGQDAVMFNREFADRGLASSIARFSPLMDETMLLASGPEATYNLYASAGYFTSLATAGAMDLLSAYVARYGPGAPPLNNMAEACHEGILLLREMHQVTGSKDVNRVMTSVDRAGFDGPRGPVSMKEGVCVQQVHLARADGFDFDILASLAIPG